MNDISVTTNDLQHIYIGPYNKEFILVFTNMNAPKPFSNIRAKTDGDTLVSFIKIGSGTLRMARTCYHLEIIKHVTL